MDGGATVGPIAVVGLGNMGSALAAALLSNGFPLVVWNRTTSKSKPLVQKGATLADSVAEAASMAEVMTVCVSEHSVIKNVIQNSVVAEALQGKSLLQLGTVTAEQARDTANWAKSHKVGYLEGSILGVPDNIADGTAIIVCSGASHRYDELKPIMEAFGKPQYLSESIGAAYEFDKVIYPFGYGAMLGFIQGAAMAHVSGYSLRAYTDILTQWMKPLDGRLKKFGGLIAAGDFRANLATLKVWAAGIEKSLNVCRSLGVDDTLPAALMRMLQDGIDKGFEDEEILAVFKTLAPKR